MLTGLKSYKGHTDNSFLAYSLVCLIIVYIFKGFLYPTGAISVSIAVLEMGLCAYLGLLALKFRHRNSVINMVFILSALIILSFLISPKTVISDFGFVSTFAFFRSACGALWMCFASYYLARTNKISLNLVTLFFYVYFFAAVIMFFYNTFTLMENLEEEFVTSNAAYRFVYIMPFIALIKGRIKVMVLWIIALALAIISTKRGAVLSLCLEFAIFYIWKFSKSRKKFIFILIAIAVALISWHYINLFYQDNPYLQLRVEMTLEGGSSGRDDLITTLLHRYFDGDLFEMLFGFGFANTLAIAGNYAHNDWVEMLIDCGFVGFIVYLIFYIKFLKNILSTEFPFKAVLILIFAAFLSASLYSMVIFDEWSNIGFLWLGLILGWKDYYRYTNRRW